MNRKNRFMLVAVLSIVFVLIAGGVWAAPQLPRTVQPPLENCTDTSTCVMGTAVFTTSAGCTLTASLVTEPGTTFVPAPTGLAFLGDTFKVTTALTTCTVKACYAYTPPAAGNQTGIYKLNEEVTPNIWVEIPGAVISNGTICVNSGAGVFSLIGSPPAP